MATDETDRIQASHWFCKPAGCHLTPVLLRPATSCKPSDYSTLANLGETAGQSWREAIDGAREAWRYTMEHATVGVTYHRRPAGRRLRKTGGLTVQPNTRRVTDEDWARIVAARKTVRQARLEQARIEAEAFERGEPMTVGCRLD